jgi:hypothetical protein
LVFFVAAKLYLFPRLSELRPEAIRIPILLLHSFRHFGLMFLAPGAVYPGMPSQFATPAAFGDFLAALLALASIAAIVMQSPFARLLVWVFNIEGTLDLMLAIVLANVYNSPPFMDPAYWIPALWVPALLVTHYVVFVILLKRWPKAA